MKNLEINNTKKERRLANNKCIQRQRTFVFCCKPKTKGLIEKKTEQKNTINRKKIRKLMLLCFESIEVKKRKENNDQNKRSGIK